MDCYGAFVSGQPPKDFPLQVEPIVHLTKNLTGPLLGTLRRGRPVPVPADVAELEAELKAQGKEYEFHSYEDAGHAFFSVDRPSYRPQAASDGWNRILDFFGRHLASS